MEDRLLEKAFFVGTKIFFDTKSGEGKKLLFFQEIKVSLKSAPLRIK